MRRAGSVFVRSNVVSYVVRYKSRVGGGEGFRNETNSAALMEFDMRIEFGSGLLQIGALFLWGFLGPPNPGFWSQMCIPKMQIRDNNVNFGGVFLVATLWLKAFILARVIKNLR